MSAHWQPETYGDPLRLARSNKRNAVNALDALFAPTRSAQDAVSFEVRALRELLMYGNHQLCIGDFRLRRNFVSIELMKNFCSQS
jgi:hypothetical protein